MCFGYQVFETVEKFSSEVKIIDSDYNRIYTLANLDKATPEELKTLKAHIFAVKVATLLQTTSF